MSSSRVALCEHILAEHFGAAVGKVASVLLARGRLAYETLIRLIPSRVLSQRAVMESLLVLVQHNCLYHVVDDQDGLEYFEINVEEVLLRRRYGYYMAVARDTWGKKGADVVARVLSEGKIQLATLVKDMHTLPNATSLDRKQTVKTIYELLSAGVLRPVKAHDHSPSIDQDLQYERELTRQVKGPVTSRDVKYIKGKVEDRRKEMLTEERVWGEDGEAYEALCQEISSGVEEDIVFESSHSGDLFDAVNGQTEQEDDGEEVSVPRKRKAGQQGGPSGSKARRLHLPFNDTKYVRVMFLPFNIRIRNEIIVRGVRTHRGGAPARIVQAILNDTIRQQASLDEDSTAFISPHKLVEAANKRSPTRQTVPLPDMNGHSNDDDTSLQHAFFSLFPRETLNATKGLERSGQWQLEDKDALDLVIEVLHSLANTPDDRPKPSTLPYKEDVIEARLDKRTLRGGSWLKTEMSGNSRKNHVAGWAVDFSSAYAMIKYALVETFIKKRFKREDGTQTSALRVWRALDERGRLDEKSLQKIVLLTAAEVREAVGKLMSAGLVTQQEIPRTMDRNPAKSFFTWHVDRESCYTVLLSMLYESLVNLNVRREAELLAQRALLARAERKDVRENLSMLEKGDREELKTLEWKLESIGVAMERIDRDIFILETLPNINDMPDARELPDKPKRQA